MYSALPVREIAMMFQKGNKMMSARKMNRQMLKISKIREPMDCLIAVPPMGFFGADFMNSFYAFQPCILPPDSQYLLSSE